VYLGVEVQLHSFFDLCTRWEWSASRPGRFIPRERARKGLYLIYSVRKSVYFFSMGNESTCRSLSPINRTIWKKRDHLSWSEITSEMWCSTDRAVPSALIQCVGIFFCWLCYLVPGMFSALVCIHVYLALYERSLVNSRWTWLSTVFHMFPVFVESKGSLLCSQKPETGTYLELVKSSLDPHTFHL